MFKKLRFSIFIIDIIFLWFIYFAAQKTLYNGRLTSFLLYASLMMLFYISLRGYDFFRIHSPRWTMISFSIALFLSLFFNTFLALIFQLNMNMDTWGVLLYFLIFVNLFNPTFFRFFAARQKESIILPEDINHIILSHIQEEEFLEPVLIKGEKVKREFGFYQKLSSCLGELPKEIYEQMDGQLFEKHLSSKKITRILVRTIDLILSIVFFILAAPFLLICSLCLLLFQGKPVLYKQERIGKAGKPFILYKFRTLTQGEAKVTDIEKDHMERSTSIGKFLRSLRLDELPQLFNCIKGDMSLVGPRPEMPYFHELCKKEIPNYTKRLLVRPGITGWAQTMYKRSDTLEEYRIKTGYDFHFLLHYSIGMYFTSLLYTLDTLVYRKE